MWDQVGKKKVLPFDENKQGSVNAPTKMTPEDAEEQKKRKTFLRYDRSTGKTKEQEIPEWDKQTFDK